MMLLVLCRLSEGKRTLHSAHKHEVIEHPEEVSRTESYCTDHVQIKANLTLHYGVTGGGCTDRVKRVRGIK